MAQNIEKFWERMGDVRVGMLGLANDGKMVPMSPNLDDNPNEIWFITAQGTDLANAVTFGAEPAQFVVADGSAGLYAQVEGVLSLSDDTAKLDEIWSTVASAWFEDGKEDPDVRLMKFSPRQAQVWVTGTSGLKFLYEIAEAKLTGDKPDAGEHFSVSF